MSDVVFTPTIEFTCPCGQRAALGYINNVPTATHDMPYCPDFEQMDPVDYSTWVRKLKQGGTN